MTEPKRIEEAAVRQTVKAAFRWLKQNGHTDAKTVRELVQSLGREGSRHPVGSTPSLVTEALRRAHATVALTAPPAAHRALAEVRRLKARLPKVLSALEALDRERASHHTDPELRQFAQRGQQLLAVIAKLTRQLETYRQVRLPVGRTEWGQLVSQYAVRLRRNGLAWAEIALIFPGVPEGPEKRVDQLRKQVSRLNRRSGQQKTTKKRPDVQVHPTVTSGGQKGQKTKVI